MTHFGRNFAIGIAVSLLAACGPPESDPSGPVGMITSGSVNVTALTVTPTALNEGATVTANGGTVTALAPDLDLTRVEIRWGENDPTTGLEIRTVVCQDGGATPCSASEACDGFTHTYHDSLDTNNPTVDDHTVTCFGENSATGASGTQTDTVIVNDVATNVDARTAAPNTYTVQEDAVFTPTASFTDPSFDGATAYETYNCNVSWGDATPNYARANCSNATVNSSHTFVNNGTFTMTVLVTNTQSDAAAQTGPNTAVITVTDHQPTVSVITAVPATGTERVSTAFSATATANANEPILSCAWNWGDGSPLEPEPECVSGSTSASVAASHTFADGDPTGYTVELQVTDADSTTIRTLVYTVNNAAAVLSAPTTVTNPIVTGQNVTFTASFTDSPDSFWFAEWDFEYDGVTFNPTFSQVRSTAGTTSATTNYATAGIYTVAVQVTDQSDAGGNPGGGSVAAFQTANFQVFGAPIINLITYTDIVAEGDAAAVDVDAVDGNSPATPLTYSIDWDNDGCSAAQDDFCGGSIRSGSHYYANIGTHTVRVSVANGAGIVTSETRDIIVTDAKPLITAISNSSTKSEGQAVTVHVELAASTGDTYTLDYTWGDATSSPNCGRVCAHTYGDEGTGSYTINVTVTDDEGNVATGQTTATVTNAVPTATVASGCGSSSALGYACDLNASDVAADTVSFSLTFGPAGMSIGSANGVISWSPTADQSRSSQSYQVKLRDNDGGESYFSQTVTSHADSDADGLSDAFEAAYPGSANAGDDGDADGLTNLEEFQGGSDPAAFNGPAAPTAFSPTNDDTVDTTPTLVVNNASDPDGDALTYDFQVFDNAALTGTPDFEVLDVAEEGIATAPFSITSVDVATQLSHNTDYWWRARANDGNVDGTWSASATFRTSAGNTAPTAPAVASPANGAEVTDTTPDLSVTNSTDTESDTLSYEFQVSTSIVFAGAEGQMVAAGTTTTTLSSAALADNTTHYWRVRAWDGESFGNWVAASFFVDAVNEAPSAPVPVDPGAGAIVNRDGVVLSVENSTDPEADTITYDFQLFGDEEMTELIEEGTSIAAGAGGVTSFAPGAVEGLRAGKNYWWTAVAIDAGGAASAASSPSMFRTAGGEKDSTGSCSVAPGSSGATALAGLALSLVAVLRRRRS